MTGAHRTGAPTEEPTPTVQEIVERARAEGRTDEQELSGQQGDDDAQDAPDDGALADVPPARPVTGSSPLPPAPYGAVPPPLAAPSSSALAGHPTNPPRPATPPVPRPDSSRPQTPRPQTPRPQAPRPQAPRPPAPRPHAPGPPQPAAPPHEHPAPSVDRGPSTRVSPLGAALAPPVSDRPRPGEQHRSDQPDRRRPHPDQPLLPPVLPVSAESPGTGHDQAPPPPYAHVAATPRRDRYVQPVEDTQLIPVLPPVPSSFEQQDTDPGQPPPRQEEPGRSRGILRAAGTMAVASLVSRVTGLVRTIVLAAVLGVTAVNDAYTVVNTLPNIVYELLLGGVLTSVIVPLLVHAQERDRDGGVSYAQRLTTVALAGLTVMTAFAVLVAPLLTRAYGIVGDPDQVSLANWLARILLVEIVFYGLGAFATAILNARGVFGWPAWAPVLNNLVVIATAVLFVLAGGPGDLTPVTITDTQVWLLGGGTTLGIAVQAVVLVPQLRKVGVPLRPRWGLRGTGLGEAGTLGLWVIGYVAISQVGVLVATRVANVATSEGGLGPAAFSIASLLFQMPYGIIGVALLTALVPRMSRAASRRDVPAVAADLSLGMRLSAVGLLPVTAFLIPLGPALATVGFAHGQTSVSEARSIGTALAIGAFGLLPMAVTLLQLRVFYAMKDARTPTLIQVAMVVVRVPLLLLVPALVEPRHVVAGLMVATSVTYLAGWFVGHLALRRRLGTLRTGDAAATVLRVLLVSVVAAVAGWGAVQVTSDVAGTAVVGSLVALAVGTVVVGAVVVGGVVLARVPEVAGPVAAVRARLGRPRR